MGGDNLPKMVRKLRVLATLKGSEFSFLMKNCIHEKIIFKTKFHWTFFSNRIFYIYASFLLSETKLSEYFGKMKKQIFCLLLCSLFRFKTRNLKSVQTKEYFSHRVEKPWEQTATKIVRWIWTKMRLKLHFSKQS